MVGSAEGPRHSAVLRRPGRFSTAAVILTLIAILLMFLGATAAQRFTIRTTDDALTFSATTDSHLPRMPTARISGLSEPPRSVAHGGRARA